MWDSEGASGTEDARVPLTLTLDGKSCRSGRFVHSLRLSQNLRNTSHRGTRLGRGCGFRFSMATTPRARPGCASFSGKCSSASGCRWVIGRRCWGCNL
jgi:hypothetical protein